MNSGVKTMAAGLGLMAVTIGGVAALAGPRDQDGGAQAQPQRPDIGGMLIAGLQQSPGCLGVDAGQMMSGKNVIVAWFENKAAVTKWYYSQTHLRAIRQFIKVDFDHEPLEFVTDEQAPIMVIASITPATEEELAAVGMPISQIAIELFAPLPGGASINGRFSPESFPVEHLEVFDPAVAAGG
ncbi:MAG: hypothetical protein H6813_03660 [Phycisphaeraceae bacterium]|nr:hypothetical protein [Phycisphaeraceae bacterium]MCB9847044.1 hypothetical protein [Phycisphaeraceae bacterium]